MISTTYKILITWWRILKCYFSEMQSTPGSSWESLWCGKRSKTKEVRLKTTGSLHHFPLMINERHFKYRHILHIVYKDKFGSVGKISAYENFSWYAYIRWYEGWWWFLSNILKKEEQEEQEEEKENNTQKGGVCLDETMCEKIYLWHIEVSR